MICFGCGGENAASFRFCRSCGRPLGQACLACRFENPPESKFCGGCGARLQEVRVEDAQGERRQLTVLFCDIVGSTQLSQMLDPEDLSELVAAYQKTCGEAVRAHEGHIAHYLGDGVVVYFGYPRSHEDEAQRAVRCGLDILKGVLALRDSGRIPADTALDVRLGAHTGRVVVGPVGAGDRKDRLALGDTPNIAARIQAEAETGTLTVSEATWKIVDGYFTGKCLGMSHLRGVSEPMRLWLVTGESRSRERVEVASTLTPFIGRLRERSILEDAWKDCQTGRSQFVLLRGEPGIGKSRLAQLFRHQVQLEAIDLMEMRATLYNCNSPFHPVIELIKRRFQLDDRVSPAERLDRLQAGLLGLCLDEAEAVSLFVSLLSVQTEDSAPLSLAAARRRSRTMELLVRFVAAIAGTGPTMLLVEDLQWADTSTLRFLELLVTVSPHVPLLGVFTARSEFDLNWLAGPTLRTVQLHNLEDHEAEALVRGVIPGKALPSDVLQQIVDRSDGVPLFLEELARSILDSGALKERAASWEALGPVSSAIPATMDAALMSRIDQLGASRATAQLAATIGREFSFGLLGQVSERDQATLRQDLERLLRAGLAQPASHEANTFQFKHALVQDAAYNSLLRSTRQSFHRRIAAALREGFANQRITRPDLIAHHLTRAGEDDEAAAFWQAAGQQAMARTAIHEAAEHLERAVDCLLRLSTTSKRLEHELKTRIFLRPLWGTAEVEQDNESALELAQELERFDLSYAPRWALWTVRWIGGELVSALEAAEAVLQLARASGVPKIELTGRHAFSYTLFSCGEYERAIEEADAGLALFDFEQEKQLANLFGLSPTVSLRHSRGNSLWMLGRVLEAEDEWERMIKLGRRLQHPPSFAHALAATLYSGALRYCYIDQMERLAAVVDELLALAKEEDFFLWYAQAYTFRGIVAQALGDGQARDQMLEGLELWEKAGARLTLVMMNVFCAEAFYRLGDDDQAFRRLDAAEAETARGEAPLAPDIWRVRGRLLAREGEHSAAEAAYRQAMERAAAQRALSLELRAALDLYELQAHHGRAEEGRARLAGLLERFTQGLDQPEPARAVAIVQA